MSNRIRDLSLELSNRLDLAFGDEDLVKYTRAYFSCFNIQHCEKDYYIHCIGSRCDGCISKDSDLDIMHVLNDICVEDASYVKHNKYAPLIAVTSPRSSYVQIQFNHILKSDNLHINRSVIYYDRRLLLCSSFFVKSFYPSGSGDIVGPSTVRTLSDGRSNDNVMAFQYNSWPKIADEWINRQRKYSWPNPKLVNFIESKGCQYVPVGEYNSPYNYVEWRVSFVLSECALVRSFNHVQFKVYSLLKLLKLNLQREYKHSTTLESLITSYHMKTVIFFVIENSPTSLWSNRNIIFCFRMCIVCLRHFVISKYLPHYFLPQCNLLKKLSEAYQEHTNIASALSRYLSNPMSLINPLIIKYDVCYPFRKYNELDTMQNYSCQLPYRTSEWKIFMHCILDNYISFSDFEFMLVTKMTLDNIYSHIIV